MLSDSAFVHHLHRAFTSPIQLELVGVKIAGNPLVVGGHVDDQILFVKCDEDIRRMWRIYESFEDCTKALINHKKTRLLGLGVSKERKQCHLKGLTSSPNIKVPSIAFVPQLKRQ